MPFLADLYCYITLHNRLGGLGLVIKLDGSFVLLTLITGNLFNLRRNQSRFLQCKKHE